jgi:TPP-dependent indolepyruvate ferredoxin oxidoreductase alpha subunit
VRAAYADLFPEGQEPGPGEPFAVVLDRYGQPWYAGRGAIDEVAVDEAVCLGEACGCNRFCTRVFRCPALFWDKNAKKARVDDVLCAGCGVCAQICPSGAIQKKELVWAA